MDEEAPAPRFRLPFFRAVERPPALPRHGLRVRSDFEGGNAEAVTVVSPSHLRFAARADSSPRPLWFYFCIQDARVPAIRCDLTNADQCLGPRSGWRTARPVFSSDGRNWQRVTRTNYVEETATSGYFTFTAPVVGRSLYVAYCYPYTTADLNQFVQSLPTAGAGVETGELCRSGEDRPVPYLRCGNHVAPTRSVWVIARQHAGETPASFTAQGMMEALAAVGPERLACVRDTAFHVVPMLDVDGVARGSYGKDQEPVDFNRD
ncbi:MAG TPA: M14-type cytosolic carboxypeptidase, partial [Armatimonadota bacterium]|nr:M14-type cytosolic carboxypeptidase [Armatimonadota bacterium]